MCGRCACFLQEDTLSRACSYKDANDKYRTVSWTNSELELRPSYNIGPRDVLPCIAAGSHFGREDDKVLCAMMWGMIPPWHEGDYRKHTMSTHNGRLENIQNSKLYAPSLRKGQRCVVVCEGYYEWKAGKTKKDPKQPYYIYASQDEGVKADDPGTWKDEWSEETGWKGFKTLKIAGIFNTFKTGEGKMIYSCTMITTNSNDVLSWLHHRVPVLLTEKEAEVWLNQDVSVNEALDVLKQSKLLKGNLSWHTVSTLVNNVLHKSEECRKQIKPVEQKKSGPTGFMASWLKRGSAESAKRKSKGADDSDGKSESEEDGNPKKIAKSKK